MVEQPPLLKASLQGIIPDASLQIQALSLVPEIRLALIDQTYPQHALDDEAIQRIMENPLYWVFCWASGQVLARYILDHPGLVAGRRVVDFGAGSGVVAIAAALAGAREVIACDLDPVARTACGYNAALNGVTLATSADFESLDVPLDVILVADVLYDRDNLFWLDRFVERAAAVIVADSRVRDFDVPPYRAVGSAESHTQPDLDESPEFRRVTLYGAGLI